MFEDFFNHRCDIYHLVSKEKSAGYGIETEETMEREDTPSLKNVQCHFHVRTNSLSIIQNQPFSSLEGTVKLSLPIGTDIRKNDVIMSSETGFCYRADVPKTIHGWHHIIVALKREEGVKGAI